MVLFPKPKFDEKFYTKLSYINSEIHNQLCANNNAFNEFHKSVHYEINIIIMTYITSSNC